MVRSANLSYLMESDSRPSLPMKPESVARLCPLDWVGPRRSRPGFHSHLLNFGEFPVTCYTRWIGGVIVALTVAAGSAEAQFYGGGYWGGGGAFGGATVQGDELRGAGVYAMGMGRYNVETAQAMSINSDTAMRWNQYMYASQKEAERIWAERTSIEETKSKNNYKAIQDRMRNNPTTVDISKGNALNFAMTELANPNIFPKAVYYGTKMKVGGEDIRDIPFQYASAAISTSVHQLTQGGPPAFLKTENFAADRASLKGIAADLKKEGEELGAHKPETIKKAKDQILATKAKIEATFPKGTPERLEADKYIKALYGLASMLETPAVNVLLAGVENRPEATLGDLMDFMATYNLRFGAATTDRQKAVYRKLYPMLTKIRAEVSPNGPQAPGTSIGAHDVPGEVFNGLGMNSTEVKTPAPPKPKN